MQTPRVVTDALVPDTMRLPGGLTLQPLSIAHTLLLQKIESPFIAVDGARDPSADAARMPGELDALAVVYLLTLDDAGLDALFFGFDRAAFNAEVWRFVKEQPPALLMGLEQKLAAVFARATSTLIGARADDDDAAAADPAGAGSAKKKKSRT
jgi:hypothetical protein